MEKAILWFIFLVGVVSILTASACKPVQENASPTPLPTTIEMTISLDYGPAKGQDGIDESKELEMSAESTLWDAINKAVEVKATYYSDFNDYLITSINGVENNVTLPGYYWQWYHIKNGGEELGATGAKGYKLNHGDHILWRYEIPK